jgi:hypothetical protein
MGKTEQPVTFDCKENNCTEKVAYKRKILLGIFTRDDAPSADKVVYLTCANGHTHPYTITKESS